MPSSARTTPAVARPDNRRCIGMFAPTAAGGGSGCSFAPRSIEEKFYFSKFIFCFGKYRMLDPSQVSRRLKLRHLDVFVAVVRWGSMVRAAEHLAMSQPVVSKIIAELERTLGVRLLDRSRQGVEP